jgi:hypothetical protein
MNVQTARQIVQQFARSAGSTEEYPVIELDRCIKMAADEFISETGYLKNVDTLTLTSGNDALPALPTNFRPDRLLSAYLTGSNVTVSMTHSHRANWPGYFVDSNARDGVGATRQAVLDVTSHERLISLKYGVAESGQPSEIAFSSHTAGMVYPNPDQNYTLVLRWLGLFTTWTDGATDNTTVTTTLNLPDDLLRTILTYGATSYLQHTEAESQFANQSHQKFQAFIQRNKNAGGLGVQVVVPFRRR